MQLVHNQNAIIVFDYFCISEIEGRHVLYLKELEIASRRFLVGRFLLQVGGVNRDLGHVSSEQV